MELALVDALFVSSWPGEVQCRDNLEEAFSTFFGSSLTFYDKSVPPSVPSAPSPPITYDESDTQEDELLFILPHQQNDEDDDAYDQRCDEAERKHHSDQRECVEARALLDRVKIDHTPSSRPHAPAQPMKRMGWAEYKARSMAGKSQQSSLSSLSNPVMGTSLSMIPVPLVISPQEVEMLAIEEQSGPPLCSNSANMTAMASG